MLVPTILGENGRKRGGERIFVQHLLYFRHWARGSHILHVVNPPSKFSKEDYDQACCNL